METVEKMAFGKTGHNSTRAIFGSVCLKRSGQDEADRILDLLFESGVNHIDTAPGYGDAELRVGPWMKQHRDKFFLATKTDQPTYPAAREQFHRSLERLQVDHVDLLQLHNLTDAVRKEIIMGPGGALEWLVEAKEKGLARFIGITGHGILTPMMHRDSLSRFHFDTVLLPCNYPLMQDPYYAEGFKKLIAYCKKEKIAVQIIKSIARGLWGNKERTHINWYEPLSDESAIIKAVHYMLGWAEVFIITAGDVQELPKMLRAAADYRQPPDDDEMQQTVEAMGMKPLFRI